MTPRFWGGGVDGWGCSRNSIILYNVNKKKYDTRKLYKHIGDFAEIGRFVYKLGDLCIN